MKYLFTLFFCFGLYLMLPGQNLSLTEFNNQRQQEKKTAMLILGGWAVANIGSGLALRGSQTGSDRYFYDMNVYWNAVNLGIATFGYLTAMKTDPAALDVFSSFDAHHGFQKVLLFNAGLDIGYMLGGVWLIERSKNRPDQADRLKGFGQSVILQGAFLFAFDLVNYFIQSSYNDQLRLFVDGTGSLGMRLVF